jgi:hypothetical protein
MMKHSQPYSEQLNTQPVGISADERVLLVSWDGRRSADQMASEVVNA